MKFLFFICFVGLTSSLFNDSSDYQEKKTIVKASELKEWITYIASDEMRGRANGSPEMKTSAYWIAEKFRENGVKPVSPDSDFIQDYSFSSRQQTIEERNVIGIIEGNDPLLKDQYIVLSAHFDHIGIRRGSPTDSICNGADDNAAGTCALIGIAKTLWLLKMKPGRTILLAAFSGEERGMRGSRFFVSNPPVPLKNIYADINFEMIGHSEYLGRNKYYMTGCLNSNLDDMIGEYNMKTDFQLIDTISIANMLFNASDNISFSRLSFADGITQGIPSGTFATSALADYLHSVNDEAELFDFENMAALISHFSDLVIWLSNNKSDIIWTDPKFSRPK
ncbi:MAG: M28 family peptidase [Bacteroidales bacterium]|nr:M28 family peptidase [Bacteroidales bacterium]